MHPCRAASDPFVQGRRARPAPTVLFERHSPVPFRPLPAPPPCACRRRGVRRFVATPCISLKHVSCRIGLNPWDIRRGKRGFAGLYRRFLTWINRSPTGDPAASSSMTESSQPPETWSRASSVYAMWFSFMMRAPKSRFTGFPAVPAERAGARGCGCRAGQARASALGTNSQGV